MAKYAQEITHFFCRPCGDYYEKTHPPLSGAEAPRGEASKSDAKV